MPMRVRFLNPSTLAYLLTASFLLIAIRSSFARPTVEMDTERQSANAPAVSNSRINPQEWFAKGQAALQTGDLDAAEAAFRKVLVADPQAGSAYANLGVIAMRRKDWGRAILLLRKAEKLEPKMAGIRLNLGIVEYRRGNYAAAIAPLSSVLRDQPDSQQARYLLGLCQVFTKKFAEAAAVLEPLWSEKSNDVLYLYLYDIAAMESGKRSISLMMAKKLSLALGINYRKLV